MSLYYCHTDKSLAFIQRLTKRAPDAGDSAHIPNIFHALAFFCLDGFAVQAPAQVTQSVGQFLVKKRRTANKE